jgi:PAS domain S-box-containing protein
MVSAEAVVNNLDEAIFLFDKKGRLVFINKAGEEFIGKSFKEIKERRFKEIFFGGQDISNFIHKNIMGRRTFNF